LLSQGVGRQRQRQREQHPDSRPRA
jgi:hypothetical protein